MRAGTTLLAAAALAWHAVAAAPARAEPAAPASAAAAGPAPPAEALTLERALAIARAHHPAIEAQRGTAAAAVGRREQALAPLLPYLTGGVAYEPTTPNLVATPSLARGLLGTNGSATINDVNGVPVTVACRTPGMATCSALTLPRSTWDLHSFWLVQIGVAWTVWDWGHSIEGYRGARDLAASAEIGVTTARQDVDLGVTLAFYGALAADEQVAVAEDAVRTYDAHLAQTRALHDSGLRTGIDVATAESALAAVRISLARTLAAQETARTQLAVALGEDRWRAYHLVADEAAFEFGPADERAAAAPAATLADTAFAQRTELRQLELQERAFGSALRAARGSYLPALTLTAGPTWQGTELSSLTKNLTVIVSLGYTVGGMSPFQVRGQTRETDGLLAATKAAHRTERYGIHQEVFDARALLVAARDEVRGAHTLVEAAARQKALAEGRYKSGLGSVIELYDALLTDVNARFQLVQARLDLASARARLQRALGQEP
jgi:outer membrane protein TolC